jgi:hypothetical protein
MHVPPEVLLVHLGGAHGIAQLLQGRHDLEHLTSVSFLPFRQRECTV